MSTKTLDECRAKASEVRPKLQQIIHDHVERWGDFDDAMAVSYIMGWALHCAARDMLVQSGVEPQQMPDDSDDLVGQLKAIVRNAQISLHSAAKEITLVARDATNEVTVAGSQIDATDANSAFIPQLLIDALTLMAKRQGADFAEMVSVRDGKVTIAKMEPSKS